MTSCKSHSCLKVSKKENYQRMEMSSVCLVLSAILSIHPDRSQFFWYEMITLSCRGADNSGNWTLKRNTSSETSEPCNSGWGMSDNSSCTIMDTYSSDTGVYWCESDRGECSNSINITVTNGVIMESPTLPVREGETVTLLCNYKKDEASRATSNFSANFYKDGVLIGTQPAGNLTFPAVSTSDEGFYKCEHPTKGESPQSWLSVNSTVIAQPSVSVPGLIGAVLVKLFYTVMITLGANVHRC
ncbi:low affinity immunoglobulin gamma Fc region receptor II-a-like [Archocentrus centrarchus]|uniref:low affinity immunoglobulin gamma Fc region receptor II-a-like n=1 Tax=Archocentrus centrarchus TaxID=63155 RepID=UPI0011EA4F77|nr:low affinity immunoglobulin gamma Fc region receptor II-a-like [Archocentrus centrarchus]